MNELIEKLDKLIRRLSEAWRFLEIEKKQNQLKELNAQMNQPDFWRDCGRAKKTSRQAAELANETSLWEKLMQAAEDNYKLAKELNAQNDYSLKEELEKKAGEIEENFDQLELQRLFGGEYDQHNALVSVHAGAGGTDAQDWAAILLRMYLRYAEKKAYRAKIVDKTAGAEAGLKSVTLEVEGRGAYGFLKAEAGVHRLVRISPFDAEKMRHTSFALVEVLPELEEMEEITIKDTDLEITTAKASGPGGQGVNTTDSAVRIKHKQTGLMASCQNERSQLQNKETALKILKSKLKQYYAAEQEEERQKLRGQFTEATWGNQIRSYVLHPYKLVKDHRSGFESRQVEAVLEGNLDEVIEAYLKSL